MAPSRRVDYQSPVAQLRFPEQSLRAFANLTATNEIEIQHRLADQKDVCPASRSLIRDPENTATGLPSYSGILASVGLAQLFYSASIPRKFLPMPVVNIRFLHVVICCHRPFAQYDHGNPLPKENLTHDVASA